MIRVPTDPTTPTPTSALRTAASVWSNSRRSPGDYQSHVQIGLAIFAVAPVRFGYELKPDGPAGTAVRQREIPVFRFRQGPKAPRQVLALQRIGPLDRLASRIPGLKEFRGHAVVEFTDVAVGELDFHAVPFLFSQRHESEGFDAEFGVETPKQSVASEVINQETAAAQKQPKAEQQFGGEGPLNRSHGTSRT